MGSFFNEILTRPLFNLLIEIYNVLPWHDMGLAIIALTILIKLVLWPLSHSSLKSQRRLQDLQPKLDALKSEHGANKDALAKAMMELYSKEKVNPLSSCLPILVQLPILIALYHVLLSGLNPGNLNTLYPFIQNPGDINSHFFGLIDLTQKNIWLAAVAGVLQYFQTRMLMARRPPPALRKKEGAKDEDMMAAMNKSMTYALPLMTAVLGATLPGGVALYWVATNAISIFQQMVAFRHKKDASPVPPPAPSVPLAPPAP
ncbi:membrane protein insertase YidC [Candidatus Uhrbacteria bacterium]|nr:membrane protein insertase YidC [Candidatus Uhrbacteria bacterium]